MRRYEFRLWNNNDWWLELFCYQMIPNIFFTWQFWRCTKRGFQWNDLSKNQCFLFYSRNTTTNEKKKNIRNAKKACTINLFEWERPMTIGHVCCLDVYCTVHTSGAPCAPVKIVQCIKSVSSEYGQYQHLYGNTVFSCLTTFDSNVLYMLSFDTFFLFCYTSVNLFILKIRFDFCVECSSRNCAKVLKSLWL